MPPTDRRPVNAPPNTSFGTKSPVAQILNLVLALLFDRRYFFHLVSLLLVGELVLGILIIRFIPYTKIDWDAYMQHVKCFLDGERDYSKLEGETGPAVYPALFLYAYTALYKVLPQDPDERVRAAQYVFLGIYLVTLALVSGIYYSAGRTLSSPPNSRQLPDSTGLMASIRTLLAGNIYPQALLIPLCLSKRLHSIYMLRLFNDPIAMVLLYAGMWAMMRQTETGWRIGVLLYSLALGVKMNILLFLPGLLVLLVQYRGLLKTIEAVLTIVIVQIALPAAFFLRSTSSAQSYFGTAFDFSRQFMYQWTVNWRFVPEETFLSKEFATYLLAGQLFCLVVFALFKWSPVPGGTKKVLLNAISRPTLPAVTHAHSLPNYHIPLVLFTSNLIGTSFARSLHYQFHSWYFHQVPFLLYSGGAWGNFPLGMACWLGVEYAWATYPSTNLSSGILSGAHAVIILGLLLTASGTSGAGGVASGGSLRKSGTADVDSRKTR